jgi:lambda repressor-like predicted transcriptional regulator
VPTTLPQSLRAALAQAGLKSLADLARASGYRAQTLHLARTGARKISKRMGRKLGAALGLPPDLVVRVLVVHDQEDA